MFELEALFRSHIASHDSFIARTVDNPVTRSKGIACSTSYLILFSAVLVTTSPPCSKRSGIRFANRKIFKPWNLLSLYMLSMPKQNQIKKEMLSRQYPCKFQELQTKFYRIIMSQTCQPHWHWFWEMIKLTDCQNNGGMKTHLALFIQTLEFYVFYLAA